MYGRCDSSFGVAMCFFKLMKIHHPPRKERFPRSFRHSSAAANFLESADDEDEKDEDL